MSIADQSYFNSRFSFQKERDCVWRIIAKYLQKEIGFDAKILDIGAGYCDFINNIMGGRNMLLMYLKD